MKNGKELYMLNYKHLILIILILGILFLSNCFDQYAEEKKKRKADDRSALLEVISLSWGTKETGTVVDNRDGTLTYTYTLIRTNGWIGNSVLTEKTILIRRCLIGQVYRPGINDCQGTGTKETVWGASELQWCPTNDRSCEKDGKAEPTISPAAKACAEDTFAGKKWRLVSKDDGLGAIYNYGKTNQYIYQDWEKGSIYYSYILIWSREAKSIDRVFDPFNPTEQLGKTSFLNTLCSGEIS